MRFGMMRAGLLLAFGVLGGGCGGEGCAPADVAGQGGDAGDSEAFARPVVLPGMPLSLANPQDGVVTWPIWGSAFTLGDRVGARVSMEAGGVAGLVIAGAGDPAWRSAVELTWNGDDWSLRELAGDQTVQEVVVAAPALAQFAIELAPSGQSVAVEADGVRASLALDGGLVPEGGAAGIYVRLAAGAELALHELALTQLLPAATGLGTPLRELAAARGLELGSAIDVWPPLHDLRFEALLGEQFAAAAPTEFYWPTTRGEDEDYFFVPADLIVNYAAVRGQTLHGYFLVWDFELPAWVNELAGSGDAAALGAALDEHVATTVARYRGRVDAWVVVNEAIWGPEETGGPAEFAESVWSDALGPEYIERAFAVADAADPDAVLLYNETGAEELGAKSDFLFGMASDFVARGVPIDAIGLQFHIDAAAPPDLGDVAANMERFGALGLDVYITELDVSLANMDGSLEQQLQVQADLYAGLLETCLSVSACRSYTVFGFTDKYAWDELGDASPLLFDESYEPKPAFHAVQAALE